MNVALPALVIFLVLLPGFIFRTRLKRAERTSLDYSPFGQVAAEAVLWAMVSHLLWLSRFYDIDGDYFVLRYSEAITLNVRYVKLIPVESAAVEASLTASANPAG